MERKLLSLTAVILVFSAGILGWNQFARAALCGKCRDLMFVDSEGKCRMCGAPTASGALQLCPKCSAKRHQCEHCLAATTEKDEAATENKPTENKSTDNKLSPPAVETPHSNNAAGGEDNPSSQWTAPRSGRSPAMPDEHVAPQPGGRETTAPPPITSKTDRPAPLENFPAGRPPAELPPDRITPERLRPINSAKGGLYTSGKWRYQLQITSPGTQLEGHWGWLTYDGQKLPRGGINDYYKTPWGPVFWVDVPTTAWGYHGWMPAPLAQERRQGRALTLPPSLLDAMPAQPDAAARAAASSPPSRAAAATGARVQKLEINQSNNGQMARMRVGNILVIHLPGNPATGYQWQAAASNSPAVRVTVRPQYSPPASTAIGTSAMGAYTFTFQAVQAGSGLLRLYYVRPGDPSQPRGSFAIGVNVAPPASATARPVSNGDSSLQP